MHIDNYTDKEIANVLNFISFVQFECEQHNTKCSLRNTKFVKTGTAQCAGYFSDNKDGAELVVATDRDDALEILVHEYCHLTQYVDDIPLWKLADTSIDKLDKWLEGKYVKDIDHHIQITIQLELDNEKRAVKCIKAWNLPIDTKVYTQRANAYLLFYLWLRHTRKWSSPTNTASKNPRIVAAMKDAFRMDYTKLTPKLLALFEQEKI